jgi:hypothetical protein
MAGGDFTDEATLEYQLIDSAGGRFALVGDSLVVAGALNAGTTSAYTITVSATDAQNRTTTRDIVVPISAPVAYNDVYATATNTKLVLGPARGVLANDTDFDGDRLHAVLLSKPASGSLVLHANGSFAFMPSKNFVGTVHFKYEVIDGLAHSNIAFVTINVGHALGATAAQGISLHSVNMYAEQDSAPVHPGVDWSEPFHNHGFADLLFS